MYASAVGKCAGRLASLLRGSPATSIRTALAQQQKQVPDGGSPYRQEQQVRKWPRCNSAVLACAVWCEQGGPCAVAGCGSMAWLWCSAPCVTHMIYIFRVVHM